MPIQQAVGNMLVKDGESSIVRRGADGIGWHCTECRYQSQAVWHDASDASRSLAYHMEHICIKRLRVVQIGTVASHG